MSVTTNIVSKLVLLPRLIRLRDVPVYLGMDRNRFNKEVRPSQTEIPIGEQGIAFDRIELDAWVDDYKSKNGRVGKLQGTQLWDAKERRASSSGTDGNGSFQPPRIC